MIKIYSNKYHFTLKYFKDAEVNLQNVLIIAGNFNIKDNNWNSLYPFYSNILLEIADSFGLYLSSFNQQISTQYSDNANNTNLVIDLLF